MKPTQEQLRELLRLVTATEPEEIDCEEFLDRVGAYLEGLELGSKPPPEFGQVSQHLEICRDCREELDALVELYLES